MRVAVVILNWNGKAFLERYLPIVLKYNSPGVEIVVADNASTDDSVEFLKKNFSNVRIIQNPSNGGFAEGYNTALSQINTEYYVLLNSDVEVTENWVPPVIEMLDMDSTVAAIQPKIKSYTSPSYFEYAGAAGGYIDKFGYPFCRGRIFDAIEKDEGQYNKPSEIFWATGACLFIRSSVFHEMGGFDVDLFSHQEEIDLCWRMKLCGYKILYCPNSEVLHYGGGMLPKSSPFKTYLNFRNNLIILSKNHFKKGLRFKIFFRMVLDGLAAIRFFVMGNVKDAAAIVRAHFHFYGSLQKTLNKRKKVQAMVRQKNISCVYRKSIVWKYFIERKTTFSVLDPKDFS
jgi:GT2 family glycosyltransferase